jgi:phospholipid/cholesterol/gamma-HCH transport system substrate-binding protein
VQLQREIRVGIFVLIGLVLSGVIIFLVGDERGMFSRHFDLHTHFSDVAGLKPGAPVRMGGVDIGTVTHVGYSKDPRDRELHVTFSVDQSAHDRIRDDSVVTISNKGLLGDKMLEISLGGEGRPVIPVGGEISSKAPEDMSKYLGKAEDVLELTKDVLKNVKTATSSLSDEKVSQDLKASLGATRKLLEDAASNDGFVHRLLTDPKMADHLDDAFQSGARAGRQFEKVGGDVRVLLAQAKTGPGFLHALLFSKDGEAIVANFNRTSDELATTMKEVRTGKGFLHEFIYGESGGMMQKDVAAMIADLRQIVADIRAGKGTIGALLVDPSIYEDLKTVLGNVDRNQVLRALVRYTIKQDEPKPGTATQPPVAPAASSSSK